MGGNSEFSTNSTHGIEAGFNPPSSNEEGGSAEWKRTGAGAGATATHQSLSITANKKQIKAFWVKFVFVFFPPPPVSWVSYPLSLPFYVHAKAYLAGSDSPGAETPNCIKCSRLDKAGGEQVVRLNCLCGGWQLCECRLMKFGCQVLQAPSNGRF